MRRRALLLLALLPGLASAQVTSGLSKPIDQSSVGAAVAAALPGACTAPLADTYGGSAGVGPTCMSRPDSTRPAIIQATSVTTASDGSFTGNWPIAFASTPTGRSASIEVTSSTSAPFLCSFLLGSVTATTFAGKCWQMIPTTLPSTLLALGGLVVSPIANAAGGQTVRITGRQ